MIMFLLEIRFGMQTIYLEDFGSGTLEVPKNCIWYNLFPWFLYAFNLVMLIVDFTMNC